MKKQWSQKKPLGVLPVFLWNYIIEPHLNLVDLDKLVKADAQFSNNIIRESKCEQLFRRRSKPFALVISQSASKLNNADIAKDAHYWAKTCIAMEQHDTFQGALASLQAKHKITLQTQEESSHCRYY